MFLFQGVCVLLDIVNCVQFNDFFVSIFKNKLHEFSHLLFLGFFL